MGKSIVFTEEFCNAITSHFMRNEGETKDSFYSRFLADPYIMGLYPDQSERGIAADARWMEVQNASYDPKKVMLGVCPRCGTASEEIDCKTGYCKACQVKNTDADDEKEALKRSMSEPAKAVKNKLVIEGGDSDEVAFKNILQTAVKQGLLANSTMQKFATAEGYPKPITIKYIMPGLVEYEYMNGGQGARVLVTKNALDKMLADPEKSIVGKPVINEAHRDVSPDDYKNGLADGIVTKAWYEPADGWYYCEALVWDEDTRRNMQNGHSVSCEYTALPPWGPAGHLNQVSYDKEVTDGRYKHLAVVSGPRYEGAKIMNSTGGNKTMTKLFQWLKKGNDEVRNAVDIDPDKTTITDKDGNEHTVANAVAALEAQAKAKAEADLKNAKTIQDDDKVTIDGKAYKGIDLKNALAEQAKNASEEKMEKDHKDGDHKGKDMENCPMCNAEDKDEDEKKKKDEDAKNALLMNSQHRLGQHMQPNEKCAICDGIQSDRLANAAKRREGKLPAPTVPSVMDGLRRGKAMMGKTRAQQEAAAAK